MYILQEGGKTNNGHSMLDLISDWMWVDCIYIYIERERERERLSVK
jgi:hypothetical protein